MLQVFPLLIVWRVFPAINRVIFEDHDIPIEVSATQILAINDLLPKDQRDNNNRILNLVVMYRSHPWAFCDRDSRGNPPTCGGGAILHL